jgi:DNA ligase-1
VHEVRQPVEPALTVVEDKLDGVRVQAHVVEGRTTLFARGQGDVTAAFPEVAVALAHLPRDVVLDGELIAVDDEGRPRPFQALQARLGRRGGGPEGPAAVAVAYVAFDCLHDGGSLLDAPWQERRRRLEALGVAVNPARPLDPAAPLDAQLDLAFEAARARGHEGLVLKRVDAPYEAGRRGAAWRKVKRAYATLDVVITRAERGHGKRARLLSDYTFAVWKGDRLVELGKAYTGLTDAELASLTTRLEALAVEQRGPYLLVAPAIVLEVAFDGLQRSSRHDSGFALRFPRIARIRDDKAPAEADRLESVIALWDSLVASRHREEPAQGSLFDPA